MDRLLKNLQLINDRVALPTSSKPLAKTSEPPKSATHVYVKQYDTRGLDSRYRGPFKVISRPSKTTVEIKVGTNKDLSDRTEVRHWGDIKPAHLRPGAQEAERPKRGRPTLKSGPESHDTSDPVKAQLSNNNNKPDDIGKSSNEGSPNLNPSAGNSNSNVSGKPIRSTRNPAPNYIDSIIAAIDFSKPPPQMAGNSKITSSESTAAEPVPSTGPPPFRGFHQEMWSASASDLNVINQSIAGSPVRCEARG